MEAIKLVGIATMVVTAIFLSACSPSSSSEGQNPANEERLVLPTQDRGVPQMEALLEGILIREGACLYVRSDPSGETVLPVWPHGFYYEESGNRLTIFNARQVAIAEVGENVMLGGGLVGERGQPVPDDIQTEAQGCEGPYWIVGSTRLSE